MIISHKHRFIFLKTVKTASSSMEIALSGLCGPEDVITPTREDLGEQRAIPAQNFRIEHPLKPKRPLWKRLLRRPERFYHPTVGYYEHMPAWRMRQYVGEDIWRDYYKFTFVRNPWDAQVSFYFYKTRNERERPTFQRFMGSRKRAKLQSWEIFAIDDRIAVDFVGRYEAIDRDFARALEAVGISEPVALPRANVSDKPRDAYRQFYDETLRDTVARWYANEVREFGYSF
jgi:hypothetical protein